MKDSAFLLSFPLSLLFSFSLFSPPYLTLTHLILLYFNYLSHVNCAYIAPMPPQEAYTVGVRYNMDSLDTRSFDVDTRRST